MPIVIIDRNPEHSKLCIDYDCPFEYTIFDQCEKNILLISDEVARLNIIPLTIVQRTINEDIKENDDTNSNSFNKDSLVTTINKIMLNGKEIQNEDNDESNSSDSDNENEIDDDSDSHLALSRISKKSSRRCNYECINSLTTPFSNSMKEFYLNSVQEYFGTSQQHQNYTTSKYIPSNLINNARIYYVFDSTNKETIINLIINATKIIIPSREDCQIIDFAIDQSLHININKLLPLIDDDDYSDLNMVMTLICYNNTKLNNEYDVGLIKIGPFIRAKTHYLFCKMMDEAQLNIEYAYPYQNNMLNKFGHKKQLDVIKLSNLFHNLSQSSLSKTYKEIILMARINKLKLRDIECTKLIIKYNSYRHTNIKFKNCKIRHISIEKNNVKNEDAFYKKYESKKQDNEISQCCSAKDTLKIDGREQFSTKHYYDETYLMADRLINNKMVSQKKYVITRKIMDLYFDEPINGTIETNEIRNIKDAENKLTQLISTNNNIQKLHKCSKTIKLKLNCTKINDYSSKECITILDTDRCKELSIKHPTKLYGTKKVVVNKLMTKQKDEKELIINPKLEIEAKEIIITKNRHQNLILKDQTLTNYTINNITNKVKLINCTITNLTINANIKSLEVNGCVISSLTICTSKIMCIRSIDSTIFNYSDNNDFTNFALRELIYGAKKLTNKTIQSIPSQMLSKYIFYGVNVRCYDVMIYGLLDTTRNDELKKVNGASRKSKNRVTANNCYIEKIITNEIKLSRTIIGNNLTTK